MNEVDMQRAANVLRNKSLKEVMAPFHIDVLRQEPKASQDPVAVAVNRKDIPAERIQENAPCDLRPYAWH